jgi:hypothetical protein
MLQHAAFIYKHTFQHPISSGSHNSAATSFHPPLTKNAGEDSGKVIWLL